MSLLCRTLDIVTRPAAMIVSIVLAVTWAIEVGTLAGWLDAILSGGSVVFAQAIYREAEPRDEALHRKIDELIHGVPDADDHVAGIEKGKS